MIEVSYIMQRFGHLCDQTMLRKGETETCQYHTTGEDWPCDIHPHQARQITDLDLDGVRSKNWWCTAVGVIERRPLSGFGKLPKVGIEEMKMLRKMFSAAWTKVPSWLSFDSKNAENFNLCEQGILNLPHYCRFHPHPVWIDLSRKTI